MCELTWQLQGQATGRQVEGATVGITANQGLFGHGSSVIVSTLHVTPTASTVRVTNAAQRSTTMTEAYIIDAVRTPVGRRGGGLSAGASRRPRRRTRIKALIERTGIDPGAVDDVVVRLRRHASARQAGDIARTCWLVAGLPEHVPGTTIDRQCGSSQQAVHFAAQGVMSGTQDLVVAGGVQNMSMHPDLVGHDRRRAVRLRRPVHADRPGWLDRYGDQEVSQFRSAEMIAEKWDITRDDMEAFAVESHVRAIRARAEGRFEAEIAPFGDVSEPTKDPASRTGEKIRSLPTLVEGGRLTAACAEPDLRRVGGLLVASEQAVKDHGLTPRARIHHLSVLADDPIYMLTAPIPATAHALEEGRA